MKIVIDYLFWKRSWFRMWFIILPLAPAGLAFLTVYIVYLFGGSPYGDGFKEIFTFWFMLFFVAGIYDNDNMDGCDKKLTWKNK